MSATGGLNADDEVNGYAGRFTQGRSLSSNPSGYLRAALARLRKPFSTSFSLISPTQKRPTLRMLSRSSWLVEASCPTVVIRLALSALVNRTLMPSCSIRVVQRTTLRDEIDRNSPHSPVATTIVTKLADPRNPRRPIGITQRPSRFDKLPSHSGGGGGIGTHERLPPITVF